MAIPAPRQAPRLYPAAADSGPSGLGAIGWLFADMMIGLFIIALATQAAPGRSAVADPEPRARMEQAPRIITIDVDATDLRAGRKAATRAAREEIRDEVANLEAAGRRAAMVLVWGYARDVDTGMAIADSVEEQLDKASSDLFSGAITREFWHRGKPGKVTLEIYLFGDQQ